MVRTMRGNTVDMDVLFKNNQDAIAVTGGGIKMNARGDIILANGVVKKVEQIEEEQKMIKKEREKVSLSNSEKLKKFHLKRKFLTPKELQENLSKITKDIKIEEKNKSEEIIDKEDIVKDLDENIKNNYSRNEKLILRKSQRIK